VRAVVADSPAAEAGLEPGDVITTIDGRPARLLALWQLLELFRRSGERHAIEWTRRDQAFTGVLRLRALL